MLHLLREENPGLSYSQQVIKDRNSTLLFNMIRDMAPISRADLSRHSGLSPATVTVLIDELLRNQWVQELQMPPVSKSRGRRPVLLEVNASLGYVIVAEINSFGYRCTLYDICQNRLDHISNANKVCDADNIFSSIVALLTKNHIPQDRLVGVHILYPGLFNDVTGELGYSTVISETTSVQPDLYARLKEMLPLVDMCISNNAMATAYSVYTVHPRKSGLPLLAVSINEGVSAGIVRSSVSCIPLEIGHVIIHSDGPVCPCGNRGCLEAYCSTFALLKDITEKTSLKLSYDNDYGSELNLTAMQQVAEAFRQGQEDVSAVIYDFAFNLCSGLLSIVNLLAIRSVYLGGIAALLGEPFMDLLRRILLEHFRVVTKDGSIILDTFDDDFENTRKAAVALILEHIFQSR